MNTDKAIELVNRIQAPFSCHVCIYHATYPQAPSELADGLHNVRPEDFKQQLEWYARHFDIVPVDKLFEEKDPSGKVSITFDDAYRSAFDFAIPILIEMQIPATVYLIGCSLHGRVFWRDKIRYLINNDLVADFIKYLDAPNALLDTSNFYKRSKKPMISSRLIDHAIDSYLTSKTSFRSPLPISNHCIENPSAIVRHPLISYGNHTFNHYVMPSLTLKEQFQEIKQTENQLDALGLNRSRVFALPFGGPQYINSSTIKVLKRFNFRGILLNGKQVHWGKVKQITDGLPFIWRYMAPPDINAFQRRLLFYEIAPLNRYSYKTRMITRNQ